MSFLRKIFLVKKTSSQGFTLIELVIAIVVLSIAIVPFLVVMSNLLFNSAVVEYMDIGSYLAEQQLERIQSLPFDAISNEGPTALTGNYTDYTYQITTSTVPAALSANCANINQCKQVDIAISHANIGNLLTVETYVTDF